MFAADFVGFTNAAEDLQFSNKWRFKSKYLKTDSWN